MILIGFMKLAGILISLIVIGIFGYWIFTKNKSKEDPENKPIFINYMPHQSDGHVVGVVTKMEFSEKRIGITFSVRDINYQKELNKNNNVEIKNYEIFYDKKQVDTYSSWSSHVPIIVGYPSDIRHLPEEVKIKNPEIMKKIQKNNEMKDESDILVNRQKNLMKIMKQTVGGEIYADFVSKAKEQLKDLERDEKKENNRESNKEK